MLRAVLFGLFCVVAAGQSLAGDGAPLGLIDEIRIGALAHDVPYLWSGFHVEPSGVDANAELILTPSIRFLGGTIRPAIGGTLNFDGGTSKAYIDARWQYEFRNNMFLGLGIGGAWQDGNIDKSDPDLKALGKRFLFHPTIEIGYHLDRHSSISLYFEHISNASTSRYNQGLDDLGIRYGYHF
ncbi:MAG: acyloxyacyl hydrolase [Hyphomicrobiaceae bacterium]|jgi:hypothetical protein